MDEPVASFVVPLHRALTEPILMGESSVGKAVSPSAMVKGSLLASSLTG